jgi:hypothetical protein
MLPVSGRKAYGVGANFSRQQRPSEWFDRLGRQWDRPGAHGSRGEVREGDGAGER